MQPGVVNTAGHPVRLDLEALPDQQLFDVARNHDAAHKKLATEILISRCSKFIRRVEIADVVEALLATPPPGATD
jgi:hypothetical protein